MGFAPGRRALQSPPRHPAPLHRRACRCHGRTSHPLRPSRPSGGRSAGIAPCQNPNPSFVGLLPPPLPMKVSWAPSLLAARLPTWPASIHEAPLLVKSTWQYQPLETVPKLMQRSARGSTSGQCLTRCPLQVCGPALTRVACDMATRLHRCTMQWAHQPKNRKKWFIIGTK